MKPLTRGVFGAVLFVCAAWGALAFYAARPQRESFDSSAWKARASILAETNDPGCFRGGMAIDLIETKALLGATATDVVSRLGNPESSDGSWTYWVGQCGRVWQDNALVVTFDPAAKVKGVVFR